LKIDEINHYSLIFKNFEFTALLPLSITIGTIFSQFSAAIASLMYRELAREVDQENPETSNHYSFIRNHQDFERYAYWKGIEKEGR